MIWNREQYMAHMRFEDTGRELFCELFGPLIGLEEEWAAQGASEAERNLSAFGWDYVLREDLPVRTGAITGLSERIVEDTPEYTISIDRMGRTQKLCKGRATIPLPLDYPVKTMDDWLKIRHWYTFREDRVDRDAARALAKRQQQGTLVLGRIPGGFDEPRQLMGEENLCIALYEEPEMIEDMLNTFADTALKCFERVSDILTIDNLFVHEDMAGKSGPLLGPNLIREFVGPYYRRVWDPLERAGARLFSQDSDGNMNAVIDAFLEAGINVMFPFEPNAGMDMVTTRRRYGHRLAIKGGIDKFALRGTIEDVERELTYKLCPEMMGGGTVFALDHRIPNGVPIENYRYYVRRGRELLGLPAAEPSAFVPMAF
ncbi:MAG: uroporphyrinogen decarboxylase family protein [Oscillospiraceae bacterium]|nr:uroporphyrinogen decarboxylase family protein [Oscillospiraceae bacterium]